jgi:opacity protein-like surface antigen
VQASIGFTPALLPVGVRADLLWQEYPDEIGGNFREVGGLANAILALPLGIARPYLLGGVGLINHNAPEEEHGDHAHEGESGTTAAFAVGGGIEFPLLGLTGAIEARYLSAGEEHRGIPVSFGIRF